MKTPMQEMLEWVNDYPTEVPTIHKSAVVAKAKELLEKERRAIVSAFAWGNITKVQYKSQHIAGEDYYNDRYNETFKTKEK